MEDTSLVTAVFAATVGASAYWGYRQWQRVGSFSTDLNTVHRGPVYDGVARFRFMKKESMHIWGAATILHQDKKYFSFLFMYPERTVDELYDRMCPELAKDKNMHIRGTYSSQLNAVSVDSLIIAGKRIPVKTGIQL
jgi:hypothetical protein